MPNTIKDTLVVCERVTNSRTPTTIFLHAESEMNELRLEVIKSVTGEAPGSDGILGEACDVIACMVDIIHKTYPNITDTEIHRVLMSKLAKWEREYSE